MGEIPSASIAVCLLLAVAWFYAGFFFVSVEGESRFLSRSVLWLFRLTVPPGGIAVTVLFLGWAKGRVPARNIILGLCAVLLTAAAAYVFADWYLFSRTVGRDIGDYHPYLQLKPPLLATNDERPGADRPIRIVFLGGSTTEWKDSRGVDWPSRVEQLLSSGPGGRRVEAQNLGRQWYTSLHSLINYETNVRRHRPDVVVVMHAVNDLLQNADFARFSDGPFRADYGHFLGPAVRLIRRPSLFRELKSVWREIWYAREVTVIESSDFPGLESFRNNLSSLADLTAADGARLVLMTQPTLLKDAMSAEEKQALLMVRSEAVGRGKQWSAGTAVRGMQSYNDLTRQLAGERALPLIDLERTIPKDLDHFADEVHYQDRTFDLVAVTVAEGLKGVVEGVK